MKPVLIRQAIAGASALLGICWIGMVIYPIWKQLGGNERQFDYLFTLTIIPMMLIPGVLALIFGIRLFRSMSIEALKWVVGIFVTFGAFYLSSTLQGILPSILPDRIASNAFLFASGLIALPFYLYVLRFILPHVDSSEDCSSASIGKGVLVLLAWILWMLLSAIFHEYSPIEEGYTHVPREPWGLLGLFVPIIVAYSSYRVAASLLLKTKAGQGGAGNPAKPGV